ncbi:MAG: hypothetical protein M1828_001566 [Chrysothrix sp. TS-e1954]|nr:MAG: hypothetical protein M1828_001566 [Chrysothrix sp. TS-e1954]
MSRRLQSKVAIITGSSSGLGRSIALRYAREGAHVICSDLQPSPRIASAPPSQQPATHQTPTHELIASRGGISTFVRADVSSAADMASLVDQAVIWGNTGRLDVMVNNAGIALEANNPGPVHETEESVWDKTMAVNAKSVFLGCKYAIAKMMKQEMWSEKEHGGGEHVGAYEEEAGGKPESRGWVVNISSIYGIVGGFNARECDFQCHV